MLCAGRFSFFNKTSERRKNVQNNKYTMFIYCSHLSHVVVGVQKYMNYLTYPMKTMRITQNYLGKTSHYPHSAGYPKDYPFDEGGKDTGKDKIYCPCDKMKVMRVYGVGTGGTNTLWLESCEKVTFADGTEDYFTMMITHPNDADLKNIRVGDCFTRGEAITSEGSDGAAANHLHISGGKGRFSGNGWRVNSKGKYVIDCTGSGCKPESIFYIDPDFTKVLSKGGIPFKTLPDDYAVGTYMVNTAVLNIRKGAGTAFAKSGSLLKGKKIKITEIRGNWGRFAEMKWVCLDYCKKV